MTRKKYVLLEVLIAVGMLLELILDVAWYPFSTAVNFGYIMPDAIVDVGAFYGVLAFYLVCSIPCYVVAVMLAVAIKKVYKGVDINIYRVVKVIIAIISATLGAFLIGNIVLDIMALNNYSIIYYVMSILVIVMLIVLIIRLNKSRR